MRQLLPTATEVDDPLAVLADDDRPAPEDRPWVMANMVESVDGAFAVEGRSGGLGTPGDKAVFHSLRALADVVLVGAGTARAENYRRPTAVAAAAAVRAERGQEPAARLVLVSRSGHIPPDQRFLEGPGTDPLVVHSQELDPAQLPNGVEPLECGAPDGGVDLVGLLGRLRGMGTRWVLCEGGPGLLGQLHRADLVDELFVTISPSMVGGEDVGMLGHGPPLQRHRRLHRLWHDEDDALLATYRRRDDGAEGG
ncbi:dihydrofolate reductase family protein [Dermatobacter hominis]|uniref:dihydrofolate reductase family protein n=1 Tax=Dermatobacter hominis TaxID=2884263 RepID=UPI001D12BB9D|nr:dihydrofolate reductase family protein [Dermatobacter hominis]UDY36807.1 dihydrofolate reductase family protein [Dermatobacter hominis]